MNIKLIDVLDRVYDEEDIAVDFEDDHRWNWFWTGEARHSLMPLRPYYQHEVANIRPVNGGYEEESTLVITLKGGLLED